MSISGPAHLEPGLSVRKISFVIPVRNDAHRLKRCLSTIRTNASSSAAIEIVVVDNGSDDDSPDVARKAGAKVIELPRRPVSELRNRGAAAAAGDVLAFVDADHEIASNWVVSVTETFAADDTIAAVGALCEAPRNGTWVQRTYDLLRHRAPGAREVDWLGSGNMAVRRRVFEAINGFDSSLQTCEDVDLCHRLRAAGYRLMQDSRLRSVHLGDPSTLAELFRGELWRGRDNLRASLRGPVSLRELPSIAIPIADLGFLAIASVGILARSRFGLVLASAALGGILLAALARAVRMVAHSNRITPLACGQALAVAVAYDLARALAIVRPAGHEARKGVR